MKISFNIIVQVISEIIKDRRDMMSLELAIQDVANKYNLSETEISQICNMGNISY